LFDGGLFGTFLAFTHLVKERVHGSGSENSASGGVKMHQNRRDKNV
jgi:hypothetical protein